MGLAHAGNSNRQVKYSLLHSRVHSISTTLVLRKGQKVYILPSLLHSRF